MKPRVLITGAAGFLGANLCRILAAESFEVHGIIRPDTNRWRLEGISEKLEVHTLDLLDSVKLREIFSRIRPHVLVNAAAAASSRKNFPLSKVVKDTILSLTEILDACDGMELKRIVHLGSSTEYASLDLPHLEEEIPKPATIRGITKLSSTLLALSRGATVLRIFSVFGPFENPNRLIPSAIRASLENFELPLTAPGFKRDWLFVEDVGEACLRALHKTDCEGEIFNIGSGIESSNEEVVRMISEILGKEISTRSGALAPRSEDCAHWCADITKARKKLGWKPRHSLREGLQLTVDWIRQRR